MSDAIEMGTMPAVATLADTDKLAVLTSAGGRAMTFADLAKAVRDTIRVGGRNLALGTSDEEIEITGTTFAYQLSEPLRIGDVVTLSLEIDYPSPLPYFECYLAERTGLNTSQRNMISRLEFTRGENRFTLTLTKPAKVLAFYSQTETIKVKKAMVTRGNAPSDWSPAPEDIASAQSGGGITNYQIASYTLRGLMAQEGGQHEHRDDTDGTGNSRPHDRHLYLQRGRESGFRCDHGRLSADRTPRLRQSIGLPVEHLSLRNTPCDKDGRTLPAGVLPGHGDKFQIWKAGIPSKNGKRSLDRVQSHERRYIAVTIGKEVVAV